jgi:hypothetical protein
VRAITDEPFGRRQDVGVTVLVGRIILLGI